MKRETLVAGESGDAGLAAASPSIGITAVPVGAGLVAIALPTSSPRENNKLVLNAHLHLDINLYNTFGALDFTKIMIRIATIAVL